MAPHIITCRFVTFRDGYLDMTLFDSLGKPWVPTIVGVVVPIFLGAIGGINWLHSTFVKHNDTTFQSLVADCNHYKENLSRIERNYQALDTKLQPSQWRSLNLLNSTAPCKKEEPSAAVMRDRFGMVYLRGTVCSSKPMHTVSLFTLPEEYLPDQTLRVLIAADRMPATLTIGGDGIAKATYEGFAGRELPYYRWHLDGIRFQSAR
jgi:hypothetical protein